MSNADEILDFLRSHPSKYCDDCLSKLLNIHPRQQANQICRGLHNEGHIEREKAECSSCSEYKFMNKNVSNKRIELERQATKTSPINLEWSQWVFWDALKLDARKGGIKVPSKKSGVYEARYRGTGERLTIGKASDLRMRVKQGLVKGTPPLSWRENPR